MVTPLHILIVDDSIDNALMLQVLLRREGYMTRIATDAPAALEAARASPPDVVLLDLGLPGMGGVELAAALRHVPGLRDCRLVAVTGRCEEDLPSLSPFERYFQKPVEADDLLAYLAGPRNSREGHYRRPPPFDKVSPSQTP